MLLTWDGHFILESTFLEAERSSNLLYLTIPSAEPMIPGELKENDNLLKSIVSPFLTMEEICSPGIVLLRGVYCGEGPN